MRPIVESSGLFPFTKDVKTLIKIKNSAFLSPRYILVHTLLMKIIQSVVEEVFKSDKNIK